MANTAVADADSGLSRRDLAARYGLTVAGNPPSLGKYTRQLWSYRHFITAYADAKLVSAFATARLGRLWQLLTPLTNAAVYYLIFGVVLNTKHDIPNFIAYLCVGLFVFNFTQSVVQNGTSAISANLGLIRALHFPRASLPIAVTLTQLQNLLSSMVVLIAIVLVTGEPITLQWLLVPPALLVHSIFNIGAGLAMARLGAEMTDLRQLMPFVMRILMYASGVLYSVDNFAKNLPGWAADVVGFNPLLIYIELVRHALLKGTILTSDAPRLWILGTAWALVVGVGGYIYFWRGEQEYGRG